jgi:ABC-type polysaccharide/polyol phosphate export permease
MQTVIFKMTFYFMFQLMGARSSPFKGNYTLYIISGIAMFMVHNTTVQAVAGAEGSTSGMMQHAPMHTIFAACLAALQGALSTNNYHQKIWSIYHFTVNSLEIFNPIGLAGMFSSAGLPV